MTRIRRRLLQLRLAVRAGITVWKAVRSMNEKQVALLNKLTDLAQQAADAVADYTEDQRDDQWVAQLNPFVDMVQQYLLRVRSGS